MDWLRQLLEAIGKAIADWIVRCIPQYNPGAWNDANGIEFNNNCYNYGCDIQTGTYAQPGRGSGQKWTQLTCDNVTSAAIRDGLVPVDCDQGCGCSECCHQVALVMAPYDYHWYRKDRDGRWSHKMGGSPATNLDSSNNIITDPRTANRGGYTTFCGCFCVCKAKVTIN